MREIDADSDDFLYDDLIFMGDHFQYRYLFKKKENKNQHAAAFFIYVIT